MPFPLIPLITGALSAFGVFLINEAADRINGSSDIISDAEELAGIRAREKLRANPKPTSKPYVPAGRDGVKVSLPNPSPKPQRPEPPPTIRAYEVEQAFAGPVLIPALATIWQFVVTAYAAWAAGGAIRNVAEGFKTKPIAAKENGFKFGKLIGHNHIAEERMQIEWLPIVTEENLQKDHQESFNGFSYWLANQTGKIDDDAYDAENSGDFYDQGALLWPLDPRDFSGGVSLVFGAKTVGDVFANYWTRSLNADPKGLRGVTWADIKPTKMKPSWERDYLEKGGDSDTNKAEGGLAQSMSSLIAKGAVINAATGSNPGTAPRVRLENTNRNKVGTKGGLPMCQWPLDRGTVIGSQQAQSAVLDVVTNTQLVNVNAKLGPQVKGGISGWLGNFAKSLYLDKALNFMNFVLNVHNATMLSRNLVATLGELQTLIINAVGKQMKNETLQNFDVNKEIGKQFKGLIEGILGKENSDNLTKNISKYNRILTSATNLLNSVESILFSLSEMMSLAGEYQGKVGNALKRSGVILEDSYEAMQEKWRMLTGKRFAKIDAVLRGIDKSTEVADNLTGIAGEAVEIPEHLAELDKGRKELKKAVEEAKPERSPANKTIKEKSEKEKKDSASPPIANQDLTKPETDQP